MKKLEKTIRAFGNSSRLKILQFLKRNKYACVVAIAAATRCSYKATSKHLAILYQSDIVDREQVGYEMHYRLSDNLEPAAAALVGLL